MLRIFSISTKLKPDKKRRLMQELVKLAKGAGLKGNNLFLF
jgi:hypothetical protein